jgi:hypothetical protein
LNAPGSGELHFLLDRGGSLIVFQETESAWAGVLAFTSEQKARDFIATSHLDVAEIAAIDRGDAEAVVALVTNVKRRAVRYVLLDLEYPDRFRRRSLRAGTGASDDPPSRALSRWRWRSESSRSNRRVCASGTSRN